MSNLPDLPLDPPDIKCDICGGDGAVHRQGKNICEPCLLDKIDFDYDKLEELRYGFN